MKVFNGIIGVMSIFGAIHCIFWQGTSFLNYGWAVALVLLLWGICAIATYFIEKNATQKKQANLAATGIFGLVFGIAGCVISIAYMSNVIVQAFCLLLIFVVFVIFMFVSGVREIIYAVKTKNSEDPDRWRVSLISGIILIAIGVGGLISWMTMHALSGISLGIMLGVFGIALLISVFEKSEVSIYDEL